MLFVELSTYLHMHSTMHAVVQIARSDWQDIGDIVYIARSMPVFIFLYRHTFLHAVGLDLGYGAVPTFLGYDGRLHSLTIC